MPSKTKEEYISRADPRQLYPHTKNSMAVPTDDEGHGASAHAKNLTVMDTPNNKPKREMLRRGFRKLVSKLASSSKLQAGPSHLLNAMALTGEFLLPCALFSTLITPFSH
jgi:hypothetical protein